MPQSTDVRVVFDIIVFLSFPYCCFVVMHVFKPQIYKIKVFNRESPRIDTVILSLLRRVVNHLKFPHLTINKYSNRNRDSRFKKYYDHLSLPPPPDSVTEAYPFLLVRLDIPCWILDIGLRAKPALGALCLCGKDVDIVGL